MGESLCKGTELPAGLLGRRLHSHGRRLQALQLPQARLQGAQILSHQFLFLAPNKFSKESFISIRRAAHELACTRLGNCSVCRKRCLFLVECPTTRAGGLSRRRTTGSVFFLPLQMRQLAACVAPKRIKAGAVSSPASSSRTKRSAKLRASLALVDSRRYDLDPGSRKPPLLPPPRAGSS